MDPENQSQCGHNDQRCLGASLNEVVAQVDAGEQDQEIEKMATWEHQRFAANHAVEFSECDDRAGEGDRTDEDAKIDLDVVDGFLGTRQNVGGIEESGKTDQDGC